MGLADHSKFFQLLGAIYTNDSHLLPMLSRWRVLTRISKCQTR